MDINGHCHDQFSGKKYTNTIALPVTWPLDIIHYTNETLELSL